MDKGVVTHRIGRRDYHAGTLYGQPCVMVLARIGKVAAAATTVTLIREFEVREIVFTGLAGAMAPGVRLGDVVVADHLLQHDLDVSPLFPKYEVPLLGRRYFGTCSQMSDRLLRCVQDYLTHDFNQQIDSGTRERFGLTVPTVHRGGIISGDQFVGDARSVQALRTALPEALCVEMEGAAVAQICYEYDIPFTVMRTISDSADDHAGFDFSAFLEHVARHYSAGVLRRFLLDSVPSASS